MQCYVTAQNAYLDSRIFYQVPQIYSIKIDTFAPISCINAIYGKASYCITRLVYNLKKIRFVVSKLKKMPFIIPSGRSFFKKIELAIKIACFVHLIGEHVTEVTMVIFSLINHY